MRTDSETVIWFKPTIQQQRQHKHQPQSHEHNHPLHEIFDGNTLKLSCICMLNVKNIISAHNKGVLSEDAKHRGTQENICNCRLEGKRQ